jgi:uncharacterized protein involved in exopolysaccharide biosynthesis
MHEDVPVTLGECCRIFWRSKWAIGLFSVGCGAAALLATFFLPVYYRASAMIRPETTESSKVQGVLGSLVSLGVSLGPSKIEDLEVVLKSRNLTVRVFENHDLWAAVYPDRYDSATKRIRPEIYERLRGGSSDPRPPGKWDALEAAKAHLAVTTDRRTGTITISFDARTPETAAGIVGLYLDEGKSLLQEEALQRARQNKTFLFGQLQKMVDPILRDRLYATYGVEVEKEMLARNREQFGFALVDAPIPPLRRHSPKRLLTTLLAALTAAFLAFSWFLLRRTSAESGA